MYFRELCVNKLNWKTEAAAKTEAAELKVA